MTVLPIAPLAALLAVATPLAGQADPLAEILADCHPDVRKWATVARVTDPEGTPSFTWYHLGDSADSVAFWPASTIKVYTVVAALEWLEEQALPLESAVVFSRQAEDGRWIRDAARTVPEMVSEVFRRSSNEDYTLLLRMLGIDHINTRFLIPAKGFPHSALMRDYVTYRPVVYENDEPQRILVVPPDGEPRQVTIEGQEPDTYEELVPSLADGSERREKLGEYYSEDLGTSLRLIESDGRLAIDDRAMERKIPPFMRVSADLELSDQGVLEFERDADGTITGVRLSSPRAHRVQLTRRR